MFDAMFSLGAIPSPGRRRLCGSLGVLLCLLTPAVLPAQGQARAPVVLLPQDSPSGTDDFYSLDLGDGALTLYDQLRRDPLQIRSRQLAQNLFGEIGRPANQPAAAGEILMAPIHSAPRNTRSALFVEASTGYVAYYDQLGKGGNFGKIISAIGRPFAPIAAADGNFALLMRHNSNGRTSGAYLYHAGSGRGFYMGIRNKPDPDVTTATAAGFPRLTGLVSAAELQAFERTTGYLVADAADGSLRFLDFDDNRLLLRESRVSLFPAFTTEGVDPATRRFTAVPIRNNSETTTHVLFVDTSTGDLAVVEGVDDPARQPVVQKLQTNLYRALGSSASAGWRTVSAVPGIAGSGATSGVWLLDSLTRRTAYVESAEAPGSATVRRVRVER